MKKLLVLLVLIAAIVAMAPGALPALEELMGLSPTPTLQGGKGSRRGEPDAELNAGDVALRLLPQAQAPASGDEADEPGGLLVEPFELGSTLALLTAIQNHAEQAGITCSTIESSGDRQQRPLDAERLAPRWHLAGHGHPSGIVAFVAQLEGDGPFSTLDRVELLPRDADELNFSIDLRISHDGEAR
ncbi:MAG: hypothetical protein DRQ55_17185 [Planctomycetota bacterium]|nr:MAG: hypothetical protein DRQ55_17185 [Planctomycetota bacterium]